MSFWTLAHVAEALRESATVNLPSGDQLLRAVTTDTRSIEPGDVFVALKGDTFDAHDFLAEAVSKGAAAVVVNSADRTSSLGVPVFTVRNTLHAREELGRYRRRAWAHPVVGVVGSSGKTSTKELLKASLGARLVVHATAGNLNNQIGVPLTLLAVPDAADIAVVEMGTNMAGEIALLRAIAEPDVVVVTSIGEEHLEGLGDVAGVLREEMDAVDGVSVVITPASQPEVAAAAAGRARRVLSAGLDSGDVRASRWGIEPDGRGWIELDGVTIRPPLLGAHNLRNAMLALAAARECGVSLEDAARGIERMPTPSMRMASQQLGTATLINDAYNANPPSVRAALDLLEQAGKGRQRVAVLGTMLELGSHGERLHREIAERAMHSQIEIVAGVGEFAAPLRALAGERDGIVAAGDLDALWAQLKPMLAPDATILLKGSRGMRLERLIPRLEEWAGLAPSSPVAAH